MLVIGRQLRLKWWCLLTLTLVSFSSIVSSAPINVHVIPHSHNDVGWLKTVDQYYYGANSTIDSGGVQYILDSVIDCLLEDETRTFMYVEIAFFERWWNEQTPSRQSQVRELIASGQLEFLNGGYAMHDEACTHYIDMIDQTALGHQFLVQEFGVYPKIGWQIDPFGHSATQASLLSYEVGFEGLFFKRIDVQDLTLRQSDQTTEFLWQASSLNDPDASIFTGVMYWGYSAPDNFCFDERCTDEPMMTDTALEGYNVAERVNDYVDALLAQAKTIQAGSSGGQPELMIMAGDDFNYGNARMYYKNLEKLMAAVNADGRLNMFYSSPSQYVETKSQQSFSENIQYTTKQDDFFPYSNDAYSYWSGFYTSRPALKGLVRSLSSSFQALRLIEFLSNSSASYTLLPLRQALGVAQHHDAVTGTSMQHVAYDYARRLDTGRVQGEQAMIAETAGLLQQPGGPGVPPQFHTCPLSNVTVCPELQGITTTYGAVIVLVNQQFRNRTNEHISFPIPDWSCDQAQGGWYILDSTLYQALPSQIVPADLDNPTRTPQSAACTFHFLAQLPPASVATYFLQWQNVTTKRTTTSEETMNEDQHAATVATKASSLKERRMARAEMKSTPATSGKMLNTADEWVNDSGFRTMDDSVPETLVIPTADGETTISNSAYTLTFSNETGLLTSILIASTGVELAFEQDFYYYSAFGDPADGREELQNSGAYIFRPNATSTNDDPDAESAEDDDYLTPVRDEPGASVSFTVNRGPIVQEVVQVFASWLTQTVRLVADSNAIEFEYNIGSIPIEDGVGKEIITKYTTDIASASTWFTDANGRELQKRVRFFRPTYPLNVTQPISGEYYPVTTLATLSDSSSTQLSVLVDRSQGVSSLEDGALEFMLHRRLLYDDARGVREPLNETSGGISGYPDPVRWGEGLTITGKHTVVLSAPSAASAIYRPLAQAIYAHPWVMYQDLSVSQFTPQQWVHNFRTGTTPLIPSGLPVNVDVITLEGDAPTNSVLIRLAHLFSSDEDPVLSQPVAVDLAELFSGCCNLAPSGIVEMTLTANRPWADMPTRLKWNTAPTPSATTNNQQPPYTRHQPFDGTIVKLGPMEIRTFLLTFE